MSIIDDLLNIGRASLKTAKRAALSEPVVRGAAELAPQQAAAAYRATTRQDEFDPGTALGFGPGTLSPAAAQKRFREENKPGLTREARQRVKDQYAAADVGAVDGLLQASRAELGRMHEIDLANIQNAPQPVDPIDAQLKSLQVQRTQQQLQLGQRDLEAKPFAPGVVPVEGGKAFMSSPSSAQFLPDSQEAPAVDVNEQKKRYRELITGDFGTRDNPMKLSDYYRSAYGPNGSADLRDPALDNLLREANEQSQSLYGNKPYAMPEAKQNTPTAAERVHLREHPEMAEQFDELYGPGAAAKVLGK